VIGEIGEWAPVHFDLGREQKLALGIAHRQVTQRHRAVDRTFDPTDADLHAVFEFERGDLIGNEAMAGSGIDPEDDRRDQGRKAEHDGDKRLGDTLAPAAFRRGFDLGFNGLRGGDFGLGQRAVRVFGFRHQNACPIET